MAGELRLAINLSLNELAEQSGGHHQARRSDNAIIELGGAGRTDAGVHALRQVAHLRLREAIDPGQLLTAVNQRLPSDVNLLALSPAGNRFHARHDATARSYVYQIAQRRTAFAKRFVWWVEQPLDVAAMARAWSSLVGRSDFAGFCEQPEAQQSTVVVVESAELAAIGDLLVLRISASHFLWKMVRRLVGTVVALGRGELSPGELAALRDGTIHPAALRPTQRGLPRGPAVWTAPPSGLFLERVLYPGEPPLAPLAPAIPLG